MTITKAVELKAASPIVQYFDEELADFDDVSPAWDKEVDEVADFDAETDADGDLNDSTGAAHDGDNGLEITFDDANVAYGTMDLDAVDQTSGVISLWLDKNDVAIDDGAQVFFASTHDGGGTARWALLLINDGGTYKIRANYPRDGLGSANGGTVELTAGYHNIKAMFVRSTGADDGWMRVYIDDVLEIESTGHDNDTRDWDYLRAGMTFTSSAGFGGSYYMDTIKIDPVGAPMVDKLAAKNGTYGLSFPLHPEAAACRVDFTNPTAEKAIMQECWFNPNGLEMSEGIGFDLFGGGPDDEFEVYFKYFAASGGYVIRISITDDLLGGDSSSWYPITDDSHHLRIYYRSSTGDGDDNGIMALYIDHEFKEALTGLDTDTIAPETLYFGCVIDHIDTEYGIFYMDDCRWGPWTDITDVVIGNITGYWGMMDNEPLDLLADTGVMSIVLKNEDGLYLPGLTTALDGFDKGSPIRLRFNYSDLDYMRFYGTIDTINPAPGAFAPKLVNIEVTDWMDYAATHPIVNPTVGVDQTADQMLTTIKDDMPIAPLAIDFDTGVNTFPTAFDNVTTKTKAYTEISKAMFSELGYCYLIKDPVYGETLVFDNAEARNGLRTPDFSSDNTMTSLEVEYGKNVINRFINKAFPRYVTPAPVILFELEARQRIPSGQTIVFSGNYVDPDGGGTEVSGINVLDPVVNVDYDATGNRDGTGANFTATLTVGTVKGTEGTTFTIKSDAVSTAWVWIRIWGDGVYAYNPIEHSAEDSTSIAEFDYQSILLNQKYMDDLHRGSLTGAAIIEQEKQPRLKLNKVNFVANRTDALMLAWLTWDVGNMCYIKETDWEIDEYAYIQGVEFTISPGGLVKFSWIVKGMLSLLLGLSLISCEFDPASEDGINFGHLPQVSDIAATDRSFSFWMYAHDQINDRPNTLVSTYHDDSGAYIGMSDEHGDDTSCIKYYQKGTAGPGIWVTAVDTVPQNAWVHIAVTRDASAFGNAPHIYINAVDMALTNPSVQNGATAAEVAAQLFIGNTKTATIDWTWAFDGLIKDLRIYDGILTQAQVTALEDGDDITDGMVFQGPTVRTKELDYFEDLTLDPAVDRLIDNMYGMIGTPHDEVITRLIP